MGGFNGFEDLNAESVLSIREFSRRFWAEYGRAPLVCLDMSHHIMQVSTEGKSRNEGVAHLLIFKRLLAYLKVGLNLVCVFDGPLAEAKRRHTHAAQASQARQFGPMALYAKNLCEALKLASIDAPNEAEALCAWLQRQGHVDIVFSGDADVLANGATHVMRFTPAGYLNQSGSGPGNAEERLVQVYKLHEDQAPQFALMALILGNDWEDGIAKVGKKTALAAVHPRTGLVQRLVDIAAMPAGILQEQERQKWHADFVEELRTNKSKWFSRKCAMPIPNSFPSLEMFAKLLNPSTYYANQITTACDGARTPLNVNKLSNNKSTLFDMWTQNCPGFRRAVRTASEDKSEKAFKSALAPAVLAILLFTNSEVAGGMEYKAVKNQKDVEVVRGSYVGSNFTPEFFVGARAPYFAFEVNQYARLPEKLGKKTSSADKALKDNSKITQFFASARTGSHEPVSRTGSLAGAKASWPTAGTVGHALSTSTPLQNHVAHQTDVFGSSDTEADTEDFTRNIPMGSSPTSLAQSPLKKRRRSSYSDDTATEFGFATKRPRILFTDTPAPNVAFPTSDPPTDLANDPNVADPIVIDLAGDESVDVSNSQSISAMALSGTEQHDDSSDLSDCVVVAVNTRLMCS